MQMRSRGNETEMQRRDRERRARYTARSLRCINAQRAGEAQELEQGGEAPINAELGLYGTGWR